MKKDNDMRKAQNWSFDAIMAVSIFMVAFIAFYYLTGLSNQSKFSSLTREGEQISEMIDIANISFIRGDRVDEKVLLDYSQKSYKELKKIFGITNDFCIHFEDEYGNIIYIFQNETANKTGIGDASWVIGGYNCT